MKYLVCNTLGNVVREFTNDKARQTWLRSVAYPNHCGRWIAYDLSRIPCRMTDRCLIEDEE